MVYNEFIANKSVIMRELDMWDQIPTHVYKHEKQYILDEEEEEIYEGQFSLFEDKNPWASRDDYRFLNSENNDDFPLDIEKGDGRKRHSVFEVISVSEHWLSDMELDNPYWAIYPNHEYHNGFLVKENPNIADTLLLNKVPRKYTDRVTQYMGDPNYIQEKADKLIYYNVTCLMMGGDMVTLKVFAPKYNQYYMNQINKFIKGSDNKIYVPVYNNGKRWMIDSFSDPSKQVKLFRKIGGQYWNFNSEEFNPINNKEYYMQDEEIIGRVNNIVSEYKPLTHHQEGDIQTTLI